MAQHSTEEAEETLLSCGKVILTSMSAYQAEFKNSPAKVIEGSVSSENLELRSQCAQTRHKFLNASEIHTRQVKVNRIM
jgi:hypothetical protein